MIGRHYHRVSMAYAIICAIAAAAALIYFR